MKSSNAATDDLAASPDAVSSTVTPDKSASSQQEIIARVLMGLILAPAGIWVVWTGGVPLKMATALCGVIAALEWGRMAMKNGRGYGRYAIYAILSLGTICSVLLAESSPLAIVWVCVAALSGAGIASVVARQNVMHMMIGAAYVSIPFGAFILIRETWPNGASALLFIMVIVWVTDIAAFLAGKGFGGPRLAPKRSPNKTWIGAFGALICAVLCGAAASRVLGADIMSLMLIAGAISIIAQAGDLLESHFKRLFGVKDASGVIPGHGGVLDRLDSLMAAVTVASLAYAVNPHIALL